MATYVKPSILKSIYRPRKRDAHKYDYGHLLVIGGSKLYHGSPLFSALAAYRSGVDLVTIAAPRRVADIIAGYAPDLITYPLEGDYISTRHLNYIYELTKNKTAVVIGGGLGRDPGTMDAVSRYLEEITLPCVVDADAIHALTKLRSLKSSFVITPHSNEFLSASGISVDGMGMKEKIKAVESFAKPSGATILLKGNVDVISDGTHTALNRTGNPFMTKGGTGDILAGICGSLLAQGIGNFTAACASAFINGKAGDIVARKRKQSMMASELVDSICNAIGCE